MIYTFGPRSERQKLKGECGVVAPRQTEAKRKASDGLMEEYLPVHIWMKNTIFINHLSFINHLYSNSSNI